MVSAWTVNTLEAMPIAKRMARMGVEVVPYTSVTGYGDGKGRAGERVDGAENRRCPPASLVTITARLPVDGLYTASLTRCAIAGADAGIATVTRIGDCWAPSTIQQAVYTGAQMGARARRGAGTPHAARIAVHRIRSGEGAALRRIAAVLLPWRWSRRRRMDERATSAFRSRASPGRSMPSPTCRASKSGRRH